MDAVNIQLNELPEDSEVKLAREILNGDLEGTKEAWKNVKKAQFQSFSSSKIHHILPSKCS